MAEPLKNMYDERFLRGFAGRVRGRLPDFEEEEFVRLALAPGWDGLELKGRIRRITESLGAVLPEDYERALDVLEDISDDCRGFPYLFFPDFVERYGLNHWERSIAALERFTPLSTSEFGVRPFLLKDLDRMMKTMRAWSEHPDEHVRRLASEGCRPRLPWAMGVPALKRDPSPILPILEQLKEDPSEYVRRSVANNLNDISKDHPEIVLERIRKWQGRHPSTDWILRHGSRGLIRTAHPEALERFGLLPPSGIRVETWSVSSETVPAGGSVEVRYAVRVPEGEPVKLRLELAVDYPRAGGRVSRKLFKMSEKISPPGSLVEGRRMLSFADLSTRRHYPGRHRLSLIVNGVEMAAAEAVLQP
ncbi:DNA alkylation repair protein [Cohnella caldifontis]|uniref:DNA alkylation repair protein n=1 Tax=Cohnella caldifontis TaxID=3027471 RepID=UPI0023EB974A|nr:DNA alkylation repair protein [Cohnella sp. YIM B05605]